VESGTLERWKNVQLTYCRGAERALQLMNSPAYCIGYGASPDMMIDQVKDIMRSFKVRGRDTPDAQLVLGSRF
jgi:hypothetical protein